MVLLQDLSEHLQIDDPEERHMISSVSWAQYEAVLAGLENSPAYHVTFLDGTLEIMAPSRQHEVRAENIGRLLEAYLEETRTRFWGLGSTTFRRAEKRGGTEPDKSYCLGTEKDIPDLAIEVIVTSGGVDKLEVYRRLGVTEVWFFQDNGFTVHRLRGDACERLSASELLPDLDLQALATYAMQPDPLEALMAYRRSISGRA
jgi:Uma2 family endonuclease